MPPKKSKLKTNVKADVHDKVREIRLRQQKWLQERETSIKSNGTSTKGEALNDPLHNDPGKQHDSPLQKSKVTHSHKTTTQPAARNTGFKAWMSNREEEETDVEYSPAKYDNPTDDARHDLPPLNLPSSRSTVSSISQGTTCTSDFVSVSQRPVNDVTRTMSPDGFDTLADQIVNRVKRELTLMNREQGVESPVTMETTSIISQSNQSADSKPRTLSTDNTTNRTNISSHACPVCTQIMVPPTHRPLLLIPCGHTTCESCYHGPTCPICHHNIQSSTPNIMLQQIIVEYHQHSTSHDNSHDMPSRSKRNDTQRNELGKTYSQVPLDPPKPRKTASEYEEEYHNLLLRCDVLQEEEQAIFEKISTFDRRKNEENTQLENIGTAQERLRQQIQELESQITQLDEHKETYRLKMNEYEGEKTKERRRLQMVRTTRSQLKAQITQIRKEMENSY